MVEIRDLHVRYGDVAALRGISLTVAAGEFMAVIGPSGCGKTTLLRCIAGFVEPSEGCILLDGVVTASRKGSLPPERRGIGLVFQNYALWPHLTALDNIAYPLKLRGLDRAERNRQASALLEQVGLAGMGQRRPAQLSGGQQQRVAVARALARQPRLLLLDEPLSNVDQTLRDELQVLLLRISRERGLTVILATHDQDEANAMAGRITILRDGLIEQVGTPDEVEERPATAFVARFTGANNMVPVTILTRQHGSVVVALPDGTPMPVEAIAPDGDTLLLAVSPSSLVLQPGTAGALRGIVQRRSRRRGGVELIVEAGGALWQVWSSPSAELTEGDAVCLRWQRALLLAPDW